MADQQIIGGPVQVQINGVIMNGTGDFTWDLTNTKNTVMTDSRGQVIGVTQEFKPNTIKGKITDRGDLDVAALTSMVGGTVVIGAPNGKQVLMNPAHYTGSGEVNSAKGEIDFECQGQAQELQAQ